MAALLALRSPHNPLFLHGLVEQKSQEAARYSAFPSLLSLVHALCLFLPIVPNRDWSASAYWLIGVCHQALPRHHLGRLCLGVCVCHVSCFFQRFPWSVFPQVDKHRSLSMLPTLPAVTRPRLLLVPLSSSPASLVSMVLWLAKGVVLPGA